MATIKFFGNVTDDTQDLLDHQAGSGIGFFGSSFGIPVPLTEVQQTTWVTTSDGATAGNQLNNCAQFSTGSETVQGQVKINGADPINLSNLPNYLSTLNIRFEHDSAVIASQPKIIIFNRQSITSHAVDVITYVYESRHPVSDQTKTNLSHRASTNNAWTVFDPGEEGEPTPMSLTNSPGPTGLNTTPSDTASNTANGHRAYIESLGENPDDYNKGGTGAFLRHDWYVALSSSPIEIGQKTEYGLYFTVDYL